MKKSEFKKVIIAGMSLFGGIVGAGVLGIPYAVSKVGLAVGLFYIFGIGFLTLVINLMVGEIATRTKGYVHFSGYADLYLSPLGKKILGLGIVLNIYGAVLAYIIGQGEVLSAMFSGSSYFWSWVFVIVGSIFIYLGAKFLEKFNLALTSILVLVLFIIVGVAVFNMDVSNFGTMDFSRIFLPYGVVLFAMSGMAMIPSIEQIVGEDEKLFKYSLVLGTLLPVVLYAIFAFVVVGVTGDQTSQIATIALGEKLGQKIFILGNLFSFFAMATSFLILGSTLKDMWQWDYKLSRASATLMTVCFPLVIFLAGWRGFVSVLSLSGAFAIGVITILSVLIFWKARRLGEVNVRKPLPFPKSIGIITCLVSLGGIIVTFYEYFY